MTLSDFEAVDELIHITLADFFNLRMTLVYGDNVIEEIYRYCDKELSKNPNANEISISTIRVIQQIKTKIERYGLKAMRINNFDSSELFHLLCFSDFQNDLYEPFSLLIKINVENIIRKIVNCRNKLCCFVTDDDDVKNKVIRFTITNINIFLDMIDPYQWVSEDSKRTYSQRVTELIAELEESLLNGNKVQGYNCTQTSVSPEQSNGNALPTQRNIVNQMTWDALMEKYEAGEYVNAIGKEAVKDGLIADVDGVRAFVPASQLSQQDVKEIDSFVGQVIKLKIIEIDHQKKHIVASRKAVILEQLNALWHLQTINNNIEEFSKNIAETIHSSPARKQLEAIRDRIVDLSHQYHDTKDPDQLRSIRIDAARAKIEFDKVKSMVESEAKTHRDALRSQNQTRDHLLEDIDPTLLIYYNDLQECVKPPMAKMQNNHCSECNGTTIAFKSSGDILTCAKCGRILVPVDSLLPFKTD